MCLHIQRCRKSIEWSCSESANNLSRKMSSYSGDSDPTASQNLTGNSEDCGVVYGQYEPYAHEPLARNRSIDNRKDGNPRDEVDIDGLSARILAARYEKDVNVTDWCKCGNTCKIGNLVGSLEFKCCREVVDTCGKMAFDGSIEEISCITKHEDFVPLTNKAVLTLVGQSLMRQFLFININFIHIVIKYKQQKFASCHL